MPDTEMNKAGPVPSKKLNLVPRNVKNVLRAELNKS
jgi:hypothetical protein